MRNTDLIRTVALPQVWYRKMDVSIAFVLTLLEVRQIDVDLLNWKPAKLVLSDESGKSCMVSNVFSCSGIWCGRFAGLEA